MGKVAISIYKEEQSSSDLAFLVEGSIGLMVICPTDVLNRGVAIIV